MAAATFLLLFCGVIFSIFHCPVYAQEPCTSYSVLNDGSRSVLKTSSSYTWDYSISGWYRFMGKAGDKMLDYPPTAGSGHRCTANVPGYLSGQHPRGSDGVVSRTVCFVFSGNTCWTSTTIQVKNCGNHFVYKLNALTSSYYLRYCGSGEVANNVPCQQYQLLTESTRIASYRSKTNDFCDRYMNGWYRFWGEAGSRMLEACPIIDNQKLFPCGAYYHGWLNATNPVPLDGTVNRTVCFSDIASCSCKKGLARKIQMRNCGSYFVYKLHSLHDICSGNTVENARYCGMRDKDAYQVTCSPNYMRIDLDRRYYNSSTYKSITLLNPRCKHTLSYDYITLGCIPGTCHSEQKETATEIVYVNAVKLTTSFGATLISKDNNETIRFQCSYKKDAFLPIRSFDPVGEVSDSLENFGNFSFHFNTYRTNKFSDPVINFPVKLKLRDWLYFEVNATVEDSSLTLLIDECYSTPTMNPEEPTKYYLIKDRCTVDITTKFEYSTGLKRRFGMQVFRSENTTTVYIHCLVLLCRKNSTNSRCKSGCYGSNINSRKRRSLTDSGNAQHTGFYKLDSGNILLDAPAAPPRKENEGEFGNFSFHFNMYKTNSFKDPVKNYPVKLKLRDWLYFEVNATVEDSSLVVLIDECYGTPTMKPDDPKYYLIKNRCVTDITTSFIPGNGLKRRFSMQMYRYENATTIYIHCLVFLCRKNSTNSRCKSGCIGNNINSRKRRALTDSGNAEHTVFYKLNSGTILADGAISRSLKNFEIPRYTPHFNTYKTKSFKDPVKNYPVKLKLRDWLYFEVSATVEDSSLVVLIEECYSTPTMNLEEPTKYYLIKDRCATDITTSFIPGNGLKRRFRMQVFQSENTKTAFIHCLVFFCRKNSTNSRCKSGCFGNNINSRKRRSLTDSGNAEHIGFYKLDSGNILLDVPVIPPKKESEDVPVIPPKKESEGTTTTILVFIGLAGLVLILIFIVIILVLRRRAPLPSDGKYNKDIGMDNVGRDASDYPTMNEKNSIVA